jgi:hypothetical protein
MIEDTGTMLALIINELPEIQIASLAQATKQTAAFNVKTTNTS